MADLKLCAIDGRGKIVACSVEGCSRRPHAKGLCAAHASRYRRWGSPLGGGLLRDEMLPICSVEGCSQPRDSKGMCGRHYMRLRLRGDVNAPVVKHPNGTLPAWLEAHVGYEGDECLIWPFAKGYGTVLIDGRTEKAHRHMCRLAHGEPPTPRHYAAHNCGRGHDGCVHPEHLRWDTPTGNAADRWAHGTMLFGEWANGAKLTAENVRWARSMAGSLTYVEMGQELGVRSGTIRAAIIRKTWAWLD